MEILVALSQAVGLAVACGIVALLPLGVLAIAALLGWAPGALPFASEPAFAAGAWVIGLIEAAARAVLPVPVRLALSGIGGAVTFEVAAGDLVPFVGLLLGAPLGAGTAWVTTRMVDRAIAGGGTRWGVTAIVAVAGVVVAALAIVPFVGFALVLVVAWGAYRSRKDDQDRYAGLRVLR